VNLNGLSSLAGQKNRYKSCCWVLSNEEADSLLGGWIYLHPNKSAPSEFGGRILSVEQVEHQEGTREDRLVIIFEAYREARDQKWRGAGHGMAWTSGLIEPNFPHEVS
jgi:hypothetical protein